MQRPGLRARVSPTSTRARPSRPRGRRPSSVRPWRPSTVDPDGPRCPPRSASATTKDHQAVGATRRPSCFARQVRTDGPGTETENEISPKASDTRGVSGDVRHTASRRDRNHTRAGLAGPRAVQRRQRIDDGAVLLGAARRHRLGQGVLRRLSGAGRVPRRSASSGANRGVCGAASCSSTERSSPRSASEGVRPRCVRRSRKHRAPDLPPRDTGRDNERERVPLPAHKRVPARPAGDAAGSGVVA